MVIVDETLYVVGGSFEKNVECYDDVRDKWNNKANIPVRQITQDKGRWRRSKGCSLRVFKGVLSNLQFIDQDKSGADTGGVDRVDIHPPLFSKKNSKCHFI